jgi:hypothetical protein
LFGDCDSVFFSDELDYTSNDVSCCQLCIH